MLILDIKGSMLSIKLTTPLELLKKISQGAKAKRLSLNLSRSTLSEKSGVSLGVIKKFEQTGQISLESSLKLALILNSLDGFSQLFLPEKPSATTSLDELMHDTQRKRGRK